jgi:hypothetical protein
MNQLLSHFLTVIAVSFMKSRKSTTGLLGIVIDATSYFLQYLNHVSCSFGIKLIHVTRDKNINYHILFAAGTYEY